MDILEMVAALTPKERIDMQMMGLRPTNPADVKRYKSGQGISLQEKAERAKKLFAGADQLGGSGEKDMDAYGMAGKEMSQNEIEAMMTTSAAKQKPQDVRARLNEEMSGYGENAGKVFDSDDFVSLAPKKQQQPAGGNRVTDEGFSLSRQYLNAFVINLQEPSYKNRVAIFKALKSCLEAEIKYKENPQALKMFREGVIKAENAMFEKLQG